MGIRFWLLSCLFILPLVVPCLTATKTGAIELEDPCERGDLQADGGERMEREVELEIETLSQRLEDARQRLDRLRSCSWFGSTMQQERHLVAEDNPVVVRALKHLYISAGGDGWIDSRNWNSDKTVCSWFGLQCDPAGRHNVTFINLQSNNLIGTLPPHLGNITTLRVLNFSGNPGIVGNIPEQLFRLQLLGRFDCANCDLSGPVPLGLWRLDKLRFLNLANNLHINGSVPDPIRTQYEMIDISNTQMRGTFGQFSELVNLTYLSLGSPLNGSFQGQLSDLANLRQLRYLNLVNNVITNNAMTPLTNWNRLEYLNLGNCDFEVELPDGIGQLTQLQTLLLQGTGITDNIPSALCSLTQLTTLDLSINNLFGNIPSCIGNLTALTSVSLAANLLSGPMPDEIGNLTALTMLILDGNLLEGALPSSMASLTNLQIFSMSYNMLYGPFPEAIAGLTSLSSLGLSNNLLEGPIPPFLGNLTGLVDISLQYNNLTGPIPTELSRLGRLNSLNLVGNGLSGQIPPELGAMSQLTELNLDNNFLTGTIPCAFTRIETLGLSLNSLSGPLPSCLGTFRSLNSLELSFNDFRSTIPLELGNLPNLQFLELAGCNLQGPIPASFANLTSLSILDLSFNSLDGEFPNMPALSTVVQLFLQHNHLNGTFPSVAAMPNLMYLDISNNNFTGEIDQALGSTPTLQFANIAANPLGGSFPSRIYGDGSLRIFVANNVQAQGDLPPLLPMLQASIISLDVGGNNLTGSLQPLDTLLNFYSVRSDAGYLVYLSVNGNLLMRGDIQNEQGKLWSVDPHTTILTGGGNYSCPGIRMEGSGGLIEISPDYFEFAFCTCTAGRFGKPGVECRECPPQCNCSSGADTLTWPRGFFPIFNQDGIVGALPCVEESRREESDCNPNANCTVHWGSTWHQFINNGTTCALCSQGTHGRLCSRCSCTGLGDECKFSRNGLCVQCFSAGETFGIVGAVCGAIVGTVLAFMLLAACKGTAYGKLRKAISSVTDSGSLKVLLIFVQTTSAMNSAWPSWLIDNGVRVLDVSNANLSGLGIGCVVPQLNDPFHYLLAFFLLVPAITLIIFVLVVLRFLSNQLWYALCSTRNDSGRNFNDTPYLSDGEWNNPGGATPATSADNAVNGNEEEGNDETSYTSAPVSAWKWGIYLWLYALYFLFFELANRSLAVFNCIDDPFTHDSFMHSLPWLPCSWNDDTYLRLTALAAGGVVVYVVGIPILFAWLLWRMRKRTREGRVRYWLGNLYYCYRHDLFWFELVVIARRLALAALLFSLPISSAYRSGGVVAVLVASLVVHVWAKPFKETKDNVVEAIALCTITITFVAQNAWRAGVLLHDPSVGLYSSQELTVVGAGGDGEAVLAVLAAVNLAVFGIMVCAVVWDVWRWFKSSSSLARKSEHSLRTFYSPVNASE